MSFRKTSIDELSKIYNQASNIKKALQNKVIEEKIGEQTQAEQLEKQYKPLISMFGLESDQQAQYGDLASKEGKKIIRMSELLNNVLQNVSLGNQMLVTNNPAYVDDLTTPAINPKINISELTANTLNRIGEVKDNLDTLVGDTDEINRNLAQLNKTIVEGKIDLDNVKDKLEYTFSLLGSAPIDNLSINAAIDEFQTASKDNLSGAILNDTEIALISNNLRQFLESYKGGASFDRLPVEDLINSFKVDDRRTLSLLAKVDKNISDLSIQNKDLADKLSDIPEGLANVIAYLPEAISREIKVAQMTPEERKKILVTPEEVISATPVNISKDVINVWQRIPQNGNSIIDLVPWNKTVGRNDVGVPFKRIGQNGGFIRADLLVGDSPRLEIYDEKGSLDVNTPQGGIPISKDLRDLLIYSQDEIAGMPNTLKIPSDELDLIIPYFEKLGGTNTNKKKFLSGKANDLTYKNKIQVEKIKPVGLNLVSTAGLKTALSSVLPSPTNRSPSPIKGSIQAQQNLLNTGNVTPSAIQRTKSINKTTTSINPPPSGMGIHDGFGKIDPLGFFGNLWINPAKLGYGTLVVHKIKRSGKRGGSIARKYGLPVEVSEKPILKAAVDMDFIDLITKRFNKKRAYSPLSIDLFKQLTNMAGFNQMNITGKGSKKNIIVRGNHQMTDNVSGKIIKIITDPNELIERMSLLVGSIEAGNMNPILRNELSELTDILLNKKMISRDAHQKIYEKYIMITD